MTDFTTSSPMRRMIETWEGCVLSTYRDSVGVATIGFGHTGPDVTEGLTITQDQADALLGSDLQRFEHDVNAVCGPSTTQNQFDALVSFSYNLGFGSLQKSTLLKLHVMGQYVAASAQFGLWNHAGGQVLAGLTRRRAGERAVYESGSYT